MTAMSVLMDTFELISPALPEQKSGIKLQQLIMTIMYLTLKLLVQDLAYKFGGGASTMSRVFQTCMHGMFTSISFLVGWPEEEELKLTLSTFLQGVKRQMKKVLLLFSATDGQNEEESKEMGNKKRKKQVD